MIVLQTISYSNTLFYLLKKQPIRIYWKYQQHIIKKRIPLLNYGVIILNRSNNSYISIETSVPQQAGGFIIKYYFGISILLRADKKGFLLAH